MASERCEGCDGTGKVPVYKRIGIIREESVRVRDTECHECNGTGRRQLAAAGKETTT